MKISDLFGRVGSYRNTKISSSGRSDEGSEEPGVEVSSVSGGDRATISTKSVLLSKAAEILRQDDDERAGRVARIKREVEAGDYLKNVSSESIAKKLDEFLSTRV